MERGGMERGGVEIGGLERVWNGDGGVGRGAGSRWGTLAEVWSLQLWFWDRH